MGKIEDFTKLLDRFIVNVHLHDNNGVEDDHLSIGKGSIDFARMLEAVKDLRDQKPLIIECHSVEGLTKSVNFVRKGFACLSKNNEGDIKWT